MNNPNFELNRYSGKALKINSISIDTFDGKLNITINGVIENENVRFWIENATSVFFNKLNPPIVIDGFEIIDKRKDRWEEVNFMLDDYEDGLFSLYCENIVIC